MTDVMAGAEPFFMQGKGPAVLVLHGFTGTTQSMRYLGEELHRRFGFTVSGPRLRGHGTSPDDMETTGYLDWLASAEQALHELAGQGNKVFVTGLSMGGTLTLNLAARFPNIVAGAVPINAAAGIFDGAMAELVSDGAAPKRVPGIGSDIKASGVTELAYQEVPVACIRQVHVLIAATESLLRKVSCPTLAIHSRDDHVVPAANGKRIAQEISSNDVRLLWLDNSYHVATLDNDKDLIVERCGRFISEIAGAAS
ncbi:alpha/beta hydrolase [Bradyrhizobium japonicum]|uniref:alpha/beta hydrolase n=1 Tax=Bradyrhizobium japonicum TaxID=375 RepID=UPI00041E1178|nr:alpha/beta fold hydrolase [Bradyrhizobium japonicum]